MRTVRLTESDMVRLVKRIITEDVEMKQLSALSKSFPKVDSNELKMEYGGYIYKEDFYEPKKDGEIGYKFITYSN